ncbi:MAG: ankyrin repeat domain-containing protein [Candidatus Riflebacteria bacterium]
MDACFTSKDDPIFSRILNLIAFGADVRARDSQGNLAFRYLVVRFDSSQTDEYGKTILKLKPIVTEDLLRAFLQAGLDINEPCEYNGKRSTFWVSLAGTASFSSLKMMIEYGANINDCDSDGQNALMRCRADSGDPDCVSFLLAVGASLKEKDSVVAAGLHHLVISRGNGEKIKEMIESGSNINLTDSKGNSALHIYAGCNIDSQILTVLLEQGADVNARNNDGNSPLHIAADKILSVETIKILIQNEADVNSKNKLGNTPLHIAALQVDYDTSSNVECLLENGADPNLKNAHGKTPLMLAAEHNRELVLRALIDGGADRLITDAKGLTAFDIAISHGFPGIAGLIESKEKAQSAYALTEDGQRLKNIKTEIIDKLKSGFIFEAGDKESQSRLSWHSSPVSPGYHYFVSDLSGSSTSIIPSDDEALEIIFSGTRRGLGVESERSIFENALARLRPAQSNT